MSTLARIVAIFLATAAALNATGALAEDGDRDNDRALELYERGEIHSLAEIIRFLGDRVRGDIVDVALDGQGGQWTYRLIVVTTGGQRMQLAVDAANMAILEEATP